MKILKKTSLLFSIVCLAACSAQHEPAPTATEASIESSAESELNIEELVVKIDAKQHAIESNLGEAIEVSTDNMREKVKQKWDKIHFYMIGDQVVRIKTYPYQEISERTEEFYLENGQLILAVVEDHGMSESESGEEQMDKRYYYHNNKPVHETKSTDEAEYSIKDSDAEELLQEVNEYLASLKK